MTICYTLCCGFERAKALADAVLKQLKEDEGIHHADDVTNGFYPDNKAGVEVGYSSLADAVRLDPVVRQLLSRKADFTYRANPGVSYGGRGACLTVSPITTLTPL